MSVAPKNYQFKLVLLGDTGVGKSSLVLRFVKKQFYEYQESTIGAAFLTQTIQLSDSVQVKFEIWDTAGQERYHSLAPMYYRGASAAIIVYDLTNRQSFTRAKAWVKELQRQGNPNIVLSLAGNKLDKLETDVSDILTRTSISLNANLDIGTEQRQVEIEEAKTYCDDNNILFMETSAKNNHNINEIFKQIAVKLPKSANNNGNPRGSGIVIEHEPPAAEAKKSGPCC